MSSQADGAGNGMDLFEIFRTAVLEERKAQKLYAQALALCTDSSLRPIIEGLIDDERRHEQILVERYNAMMRARRDAGSASVSP